MRQYSFFQIGQGIRLLFIMTLTVALMACGGDDEAGGFEEGDDYIIEGEADDDWLFDGVNDLANTQWSTFCGSTPDGGTTDITWDFGVRTYSLSSQTYDNGSCNGDAGETVRTIHSESGTYRVGPELISDGGLTAKKINFTATTVLGNEASDPLTRLDIYYLQDNALYVGEDYGVEGFMPRGTALDFDTMYMRDGVE